MPRMAHSRRAAFTDSYRRHHAACCQKAAISEFRQLPLDAARLQRSHNGSSFLRQLRH